jgi:hypothetical protein
MPRTEKCIQHPLITTQSFQSLSLTTSHLYHSIPFLFSIVSSKMVRTRGGKEIRHKPEDYGRFWHQNRGSNNQQGHSIRNETTAAVTRQQNEKQNENKKKKASPPTFTIPESPQEEQEVGQRMLRSSNPTCLHFGKNRRTKYPGFFFCQNCEWWEMDSQDPSVKNHIKRESKKYSCKANHTHWVYPSETIYGRHSLCRNRTDEQPSRKRIYKDLDESDVDVSDSDMILPESVVAYEKICTEFEIATAELENVTTNNTHLRGIVDKLHKELENTKRREQYYKKKFADLREKYESSKGITVITNFKQTVILLSKTKNRSPLRLSKSIVEQLWDDDFLEGHFKAEMIEKCRQYFRSAVFSPQNILRAMDMAGGQLSMQGVEVLRSLEVRGQKYSRQSILPSPASIKRVAKVVESYAHMVVPYEYGILPGGGEFVRWEPADVVKLIILGFGLTTIAKNRPIDLHQAIDGAQLTKRLNHTTYGFKVADRAAKDPFSGKPV